MKLVVGLGNPGPRYTGTRHNVGFAVVAELGRRHKITARARGPAVAGRGAICGQEVVLAQPTTFMNLSGRALTSLRAVYGVRDLHDILIVADDMDLPVGALRLREGGSAGGHNGLKSIIEALGSQQVARLRVGVGRPPSGEDPIDHVLTRFTGDETSIINETVGLAADAVECWIEHGPAETMNRFNRTGRGTS
jgi:PTH1 family peptidyl-tRNA hydrolase